MGETEIVIDASELSRLTILCPTCGASLTVDGTRKEWAARPIACSGCGTLLPDAKALLQWYRDFFDAVTKSDLAVTFRLKSDS